MKKDRFISFTVTEEIKATLTKMASKERRTLANMTRIVIEEGLKALEKEEKSRASMAYDNNSYIPSRKKTRVHLPVRPIGRIKIINALSPSRCSS